MTHSTRTRGLSVALALISSVASTPTPATLSISPTLLASYPSPTCSVDLDLWPSSKPGWSSGSALHVNLTSLLPLASGLPGCLLRVGGSPVDTLLYDVLPDGSACSPANLNKTQQSIGTYYCPIWKQAPGQCLTIPRWRDLLAFADAAGLRLVFSLNACWGRNSSSTDQDWSLIDGLLAQTAPGLLTWAKALYGFEYGNELYTNVQAPVYAAAMAHIAATADALWPRGAPRPALIGPDCGVHDLPLSYYTDLLDAHPPATFKTVTVHDYGDDCTPDEVATTGMLLNVTCLDAMPGTASQVAALTAKYNVSTWVGESALHASSGVLGLTNAFISTLFFINELASYASAGVGLVSRQTLMGGEYELVNKTTWLPNPDYWGLRLWRQTVDSGAVLVSALTGGGAGVRGYAFCARDGGPGAVTAVLVNFACAEATTVNITGLGGGGARSVWTLQPVAGYSGGGGPAVCTPGGNRPDDWFRVALNGAVVEYAVGDPLPVFEALQQPAGSLVAVPAASVVVVRVDDAGASVCGG